MNKEKLKVIFVSKAYPSEVDIQNGVFIKKHAKAASLYTDVKVVYIITSDENKTARNLITDSFEEIIIYTKKSNKVVNFINRKKAYNSILKELENTWGKPDIIHGNIFLRGTFDALQISKKYKVPFVISTHWSGFVNGEYQKMSFFRKYLFRKVAKQASIITSVSSFLAKNVENLFGVRPIIIENIVETQEQESFSLDTKFITALVVADLRDRIKNISSVIEVVSQLKSSHPTFRLNIVGDGPDKAKLISLSEQLGVLNSGVFFLGRKTNEEVLKEIQKSTFCIVNSNIETFSVFTLESIFSGKPVIATKCGGPEEFITAANGILINKNNNNELKSAITYLIQNSDTYSIDKVKSSIQFDFSESAIGKKLFLLYNEAIRKTI